MVQLRSQFSSCLPFTNRAESVLDVPAGGDETRCSCVDIARRIAQKDILKELRFTLLESFTPGPSHLTFSPLLNVSPGDE